MRNSCPKSLRDSVAPGKFNVRLASVRAKTFTTRAAQGKRGGRREVPEEEASALAPSRAVLAKVRGARAPFLKQRLEARDLE